MIPIQSVLLCTPFKNQPLSQEALKLLEGAHFSKVLQWINKEDAPIYKRISAECKKKITLELQAILKDYNFSNFRDAGRDCISIKQLRDLFIEELTLSSHISFNRIWRNIEIDLSAVPIYKGDTYESLAKRHHQEEEVLRKLNGGAALIPGEKIKIYYDLTSQEPLANQRRRRIAAQLFPRLTPRQQVAMALRIEHLQNYLRKYNELLHSRKKGKELWLQMNDFISSPEAPFSIVQKQRWQNKLESSYLESRHTDDFLNLLTGEICKASSPTYFNALKAMYPLLANGYELYTAHYGKFWGAAYIGYYKTTIEYVLEKHMQSKLNEELKLLVKTVRKQMQSVVNPSFFGVIDHIDA